MARRNSNPCYIYVLGQEMGADSSGCPTLADTFKVGIADNPAGRRDVLQTGCPYPLITLHLDALPSRKSARRAEAIAHRRLRDSRTCGEWFKCDLGHVCEVVMESVDAMFSAGDA